MYIDTTLPQVDLQSNSLESSDIELRRSKRIRKATDFGGDFYVFLTESDPQTFEESMTSHDAPFWKEDINNEMDSIISNHVWEIVDLPPGVKPIGCR